MHPVTALMLGALALATAIPGLWTGVMLAEYTGSFMFVALPPAVCMLIAGALFEYAEIHLAPKVMS